MGVDKLLTNSLNHIFLTRMDLHPFLFLLDLLHK